MKLNLNYDTKSYSNEINLELSNSIFSEVIKIPIEEEFDNININIEKDKLICKDDFEIKSNNLINNKINRYGNMFVSFFDKIGDPWIVIGPHCKLNFLLKNY